MRVTQRAKEKWRLEVLEGRHPSPEARKVLGAFNSTGAKTSRNQNGFGAQGQRGTLAALSEARKVPGDRYSTLDKVLGARCPTLANPSRNPARRGALGRRGKQCALLEAPLP